MRKVGHSSRKDEGGAVAVVVAILAVVLIGAGALAVDMGRIAEKRGQLQNSADAGALAAAAYCAANAVDTCPSTAFSEAQAQADQYAQANKRTPSENLAPVQTVFPDNHTVQVTAATDDNGLAMTLAKALGITSVKVKATATASWGGPAGGPGAFPMTFAHCQFQDGSEQYIFTQGTTSCATDSPSGGVIPGGFEWTSPNVPGQPCTVKVQLDPATGKYYVPASPGAPMPHGSLGCTPSYFASKLNSVILIPVWDGTTNGLTGSKSWYYVKGFAAFFLEGYSFPGTTTSNWNPPPPQKTSANGLYGHFVEFVADPKDYFGSGYTGGGVTLPPRLIK
ncbi:MULTISPECIES: pilus assembly protein TadG-related protein [Arthrobacter]|uniref:Pilus assembly protein TadG-related protein n=2 Tax=Arthrobacter TaxID=1663 RepID=A0ABU9KG52_9MICC|nr:pilus assembly protein TadG-related protein [Arthrobacter sp. YJM1]MDP5225762.1 pilus assembly protein TadG-related protein [Arthrobacter sp. YJM1]